MLRQSNLLVLIPHTRTNHMLRVNDLTITAKGLVIRVRSSKTSIKSQKPVYIMLPRISGSRYCPVHAWETYYAATTPHHQGPTFTMIDRSPLTPRALCDIIRLALTMACHPAPGAITLHSFRRGGAQACMTMGASLQDIKDLGHWTADAVHSYIPRVHISSAVQTLTSLFG